MTVRIYPFVGDVMMFIDVVSKQNFSRLRCLSAQTFAKENIAMGTPTDIIGSPPMALSRRH